MREEAKENLKGRLYMLASETRILNDRVNVISQSISNLMDYLKETKESLDSTGALVRSLHLKIAKEFFDGEKVDLE